MKKIELSIDGKTVVISERNIFSVMDMIMAAGQAMSENKNFSQKRDGVLMTFTANYPESTAPGGRLLNKLDELDNKLQQFSAGNEKEIWI